MKFKRLCSLLLVLFMVAAALAAGAVPASAMTADGPWQVDCAICFGCRVAWPIQRWWCSIVNNPFHNPFMCVYCGPWFGGRPTRCCSPVPIGLNNTSTIEHPYVGRLAADIRIRVPGEQAQKTLAANGKFVLLVPFTFPHAALYSIGLIAVEEGEDAFGITVEYGQVGGGATVITRGTILIELDQALLEQDFSVTITSAGSDWEHVLEFPAG